jgi:hypothetical protein
METPDGPAVNMPLRDADGKTELTISQLSLWAMVSLE